MLIKETTVFITGIADNNKMRMENKNTKMKTLATRNMRQINKLNYGNVFLQSTTNFLLCKKRWRTLSQSPCRSNFNKLISASITTTQINIGIIYRLKQRMSFCWTLCKQHLWLMLWLLVTITGHVQSLEMPRSTFRTKDTATSTHSLPSQSLSSNEEIGIHAKENDAFRPFVPTDLEFISRNVFTPSGQFRVFQPIDTDLRAAAFMKRESQHEVSKMSQPFNTSLLPPVHVAKQDLTMFKENAKKHDLNYLLHIKQQPHKVDHHKKFARELERTHELNSKQQQKGKHHQKTDSNSMDDDVGQNEITAGDDLSKDLKSLEDLLVDYATNLFDKGHYEPMTGLWVDFENNHSQGLNKTRIARQTSATDAEVRIDVPRTLQTGRLLFLTGLKKVLWPVFMGLQVLKSLLIAMFIPAIIGSFTKLLGKGITTGSAPLFIRPMEPPQELDFRDNTFAFEDNKFLATDEGVKGPYAYNQPDTPPQMHSDYVFDPASTNNQLSYTSLGMNERQHQLMQDSYMSALQSIGTASFKNSGSLSSGSSGLLAPMAKKPPPAANVNTFQQFQNVPDSSLLLSNYDPFYSPLLSRLDSVFAQLKINSDKEMCREKLICLMYANPAKYAPYSNLVSAQLSRELNELRKPTSDNPDILRFFKYMRAAKDGQDGVDCEKTFDSCTEFKDFDNPAMVSTYHDINKLVQARKLTTK